MNGAAVFGLAVVLQCSALGVVAAQTHAPLPAPSPFAIPVDASTLTGLPRVTVSATDESGHVDRYSGASLRDVLTRAGAPAGAAVRGKAMLGYVVVGAADGYQALFALPELDASFTDRVVVLADRRDDEPFPATAGPLRLIVPFDKREARWVRQVTSISFALAPTPER